MDNTDKQLKPGGQKNFQLASMIDRNFNWLIVIVVFAIFSLSYFFLLKPKQELILQTVLDQKNNLNQEYNMNIAILGKLSNLSKIYKNINPLYVDKVNALIPEETIHEELFTQINKIVKNVGLLTTNISMEFPDQTKTPAQERGKQKASDIKEVPEGVGVIKVNIGIVGTDYASFEKLITSLENNLRLIDISNIDFQPEANTTTLTFYTYYLKK